MIERIKPILKKFNILVCIIGIFLLFPLKKKYFSMCLNGGFIKAFFYLLPFIIKKTLEDCLPSNTPSVCSICDFSSYSPVSDLSLDQPDTPIFCSLQKIPSTYKSRVFIDSSVSCEELINCDGSILKPFNNLLLAIETEWEKSKNHIKSDIEFYVFKGEHNLTLTTSHNISRRLEFFRRSFATISLKPVFCEEFDVAKCLEKGKKNQN